MKTKVAILMILLALLVVTGCAYIPTESSWWTRKMNESWVGHSMDTYMRSTTDMVFRQSSYGDGTIYVMGSSPEHMCKYQMVTDGVGIIREVRQNGKCYG